MSPPRYSNEQLINAVETSYSYRAVLSKLGVKPDGGGSQALIKKKICAMGISTEHFLGQSSGSLKPTALRKKRVSCSQLLRNKLLKTRISSFSAPIATDSPIIGEIGNSGSGIRTRT